MSYLRAFITRNRQPPKQEPVNPFLNHMAPSMQPVNQYGRVAHQTISEEISKDNLDANSSNVADVTTHTEGTERNGEQTGIPNTITELGDARHTPLGQVDTDAQSTFENVPMSDMGPHLEADIGSEIGAKHIEIDQIGNNHVSNKSSEDANYVNERRNGNTQPTAYTEKHALQGTVNEVTNTESLLIPELNGANAQTENLESGTVPASNILKSLHESGKGNNQNSANHVELKSRPVDDSLQLRTGQVNDASHGQRYHSPKHSGVNPKKAEEIPQVRISQVNVLIDDKGASTRKKHKQGSVSKSINTFGLRGL